MVLDSRGCATPRRTPPADFRLTGSPGMPLERLQMGFRAGFCFVVILMFAPSERCKKLPGGSGTIILAMAHYLHPFFGFPKNFTLLGVLGSYYRRMVCVIAA
jgi:hypothetical protein